MMTSSTPNNTDVRESDVREPARLILAEIGAGKSYDRSAPRYARNAAATRWTVADIDSGK